jgi:hypothetical protein
LIDGDFELDVNEILAELSEAEVLSIFFPIFRKSLVIDLRSLELSGPMIQIMQMVSSPQERIRSIRRARPGFPRRPNLAIFPWPRNVNSLVSEGIWEHLTKMLADAGHENAQGATNKALEDLNRLQNAELSRVIIGENYHTIWASQPTPE